MLIDHISVIGLGRLGACLAACAASKGFQVTGVDVQQRMVDAVNAGRAPVRETGLDDLVRGSNGRLRATADCAEAVASTDITFVVVPTPSEEDGGFSLRYVLEAARTIGHALREKSSYHVVAIVSTVLPMSLEQSVRPVLEAESGKACGTGFGLCYNPGFVALGTAIRDFLRPDFVLIGESDERAGAAVASVYQRLCENNPPIQRMSIPSAEVAKIALNTFVTTKIAYSNMLAQICEQVPGADVDVVTGAIGLDARVGQRGLRGGLGYGGPCFPRDNLALAHLARRLSVDAGLAETTDRSNRLVVERVMAKALQQARAGDSVAVLGLSYKPLSEVVEESQGLALAAGLAKQGRHVTVYDPVAIASAQAVLGGQVRYAETLEDAVQGAKLVIVANADSAFAGLQPQHLRARPAALIDCWRMLRDSFHNVPGIAYIPLGVGDPNGRSGSR